MKHKVKDRGIILKSSPYSETSLIFTCFCATLGVISILAKGIRKKADNPLNVLFEYEFNLYAPLEHGLYLLADASLIKEITLYDKPESWAAAEAGMELISQINVAEDEAKAYYELAGTYLDFLKTSDLPAVAVWWRFFRRVLAFSGLELVTEHCDNCGDSLSACISFDSKSGDLLCADCGSGQDQDEAMLRLSREASHLLQCLPHIGSLGAGLKLNKSLVQELNGFFMAYFEGRYHKALKLKSLSVLEQFYR